MPREVRLSADGNAVAIRSDEASDSNKAWGVMQVGKGGYWVREGFVDGWDVISGE